MKISFDRAAHIYDRSRGLPPETMRKLIQALIKELGESQAVLDAGVGTGRFARPLQEKGFSVVGIDTSSEMMHKAKEKAVKDLLLSDACHLPFRNSSFDAALSVHLLHLISNWQTALQEICRVTKHDLFSVITKPRRNPISQTYEEVAKNKGYNVKHIGLGERDLSEILAPNKSTLATHVTSNADEHLAFLEQQAYSRQWRVPKKVDNWIVHELGKRFAGLKYRLEIYIISWNTRDLKAHIKWLHTFDTNAR